MKLDFKRDTEIDLFQLHKEWVRQPSLMERYSRECSNAGKEVDKAKLALDIAKSVLDDIKAEYDLKVRENTDKYIAKGIKITEAVVTNTVSLLPEVQEAVEEYFEAQKVLNEAKHEFFLLQGAVKAIEQRKTALENEVRLLGMNYFSGPEVPHDLKEEFKTANTEEDTAQKERMRAAARRRKK